MSEAYLRGVDRGQRLLLPECVEDYVGEQCLVRVVDAFVEAMRRGDEVGCLPPARKMDGEGGRPGYCPRS